MKYNIEANQELFEEWVSLGKSIAEDLGGVVQNDIELDNIDLKMLTEFYLTSINKLKNLYSRTTALIMKGKEKLK